MKWFEIKERAAGKKRLILTWTLYKIFGAWILYVISFLVAFFTFIFSKQLRYYSKKYLSTVEAYTKIKPSLLNQFKHVLAYANTLSDKIRIFSGNYNESNIEFESEEDKNQLFKDIYKEKGTFFICSHIGNIEVLYSLFENTIKNPNCEINVFLSHKQSQIFNEFLNGIKIKVPAKLLSIEEIGFETGIELKENLDKGDIVFIAGDRLSENINKTALKPEKSIEAELFNSKIHLPQGTFKLAKLMEVPTYFIAALREGNKYRVFIEKQEDLSEKELSGRYVKFMEKMVLKKPFQFFHFYDFFE